MSRRGLALPPGPERTSILSTHGICQISALVLAICGMLFIYVNKEVHGKKHFLTAHARYTRDGLVVWSGTKNTFPKERERKKTKQE